MNVKKRKVDELKLYPGNPRTMSEDQFEALKRSLREFGLVQPLVINSQDEVIGGNQRLEALRQLGISEVEVVVVDLPASRERALNIALNKIQGEWDYRLLKEFVSDLTAEEVELTGFTTEELEELTVNLEPENEVEEDDYDFTKDLPPKVQSGDVWQLGKHRLACGDSTKREDVDRLMQGKKADLVITDPPYGINYNDFERVSPDNHKVGRFGPIMNDDEIPDFIPLLPEVLKSNGSFYVFACWEGVVKLTPKIKSIGHISDCIIWDKLNFPISVCDYKRRYEIIIYGWLDKHRFFGAANEVNVWEQTGFASEKQRRAEEMVHPTQKPVAVMSRGIKNSSLKNQTVLDLFGGSGTTLIACEQLDRICYMMEIDPHYCDVIIDRWETYTGQKAEKL